MSDLLTHLPSTMFRFRAYHGFATRKGKTKRKMILLWIWRLIIYPESGTIISIGDTVDYAVLFEIINTTMQRPVDLLENALLKQLLRMFHEQFPQVIEVSVCRRKKLNPPIDKFSGTVGVEILQKILTAFHTLVVWKRYFFLLPVLFLSYFLWASRFWNISFRYKSFWWGHVVISNGKKYYEP